MWKIYGRAGQATDGSIHVMLCRKDGALRVGYLGKEYSIVWDSSQRRLKLPACAPRRIPEDRRSYLHGIGSRNSCLFTRASDMLKRFRILGAYANKLTSAECFVQTNKLLFFSL